jgi:hypothetical protein
MRVAINPVILMMVVVGTAVAFSTLQRFSAPEEQIDVKRFIFIRFPQFVR